MITTTLNAIYANFPSKALLAEILEGIGETPPDDKEIPIALIIERVGFHAALWCFATVEGHNREIRHFAADCAESVLPLFERVRPYDPRVRDCIAATRAYADGLITGAELDAASNAAIAAGGTVFMPLGKLSEEILDNPHSPDVWAASSAAHASVLSRALTASAQEEGRNAPEGHAARAAACAAALTSARTARLARAFACGESFRGITALFDEKRKQSLFLLKRVSVVG